MHAATLNATRRRLTALPPVLVALLSCASAGAEPWVAPGDLSLRQDIELLADSGLINIPVSGWPMTWGNVNQAVNSVSSEQPIPVSIELALARVKARARAETVANVVDLEYGIQASESPRRLRLFEDNPRENGLVNLAAGYSTQSLAVRVAFTYAIEPSDDRAHRFDGSYVTYAWKNTLFTFGLQERWWGPGYDGALALSTSARPVPALGIKRNFSDPFKTRWLSWLGPVDASFLMGQLESSRGVPDALLVGARVAFKPLPSLELGVVRTAQWGGQGREENLQSFIDLVIGRDNIGDGGVTRDNEPGNQMAGFDWRWRVRSGRMPVVFYGQLIGEDEAGGLPSRFLGQLGASTTAPMGDNGAQLHGYAEFSDTTCQFHESSKRFNCAYSNSIYPSGYRYRGRPIGHATDGDSRTFAAGVSLRTSDNLRFSASLRYSELNRGGTPDAGHSLSAVPSDLINVELSHQREWSGGMLTVGLGMDAASSDAGGLDGNDVRAFAAWRTRY